MHHSKWLILAALPLALSLSVTGPAEAADGDTAAKKIVLSNNYAGNSWRQAMLKSWDKVTKDAVDKKIVASAQAEPGSMWSGDCTTRTRS